ncbi:MAG: chemotaxis protein CheW [Deltaproteobacteria bacterium]|nr:chemotaxis protein CheW [Candidatus Zymogenaceae bacterium]
MYDEELLKEFIIESNEHLSELEENLNRLVDDPKNQEYLNQLFRAVHSIKGSADYIGLEKTGEFLHKMESILERLRQGSLTATKDIIDVLFMGMDTVTSLLQDLSESKEELSSVESASVALDRLLNGDVELPENDTLDEETSDEVTEGVFSSRKPEDTAPTKAAEEPPEEPEDTIEMDLDLDEEFPDLGEKYGDVDDTVRTRSKAHIPPSEDVFDNEISEVLEQHMDELENALKVLEEKKTTEELERFLKLVESFRSSIEYFGYDELDTSLSNISKSIMLFLEEGESLTDNEVLSFYNNLDIIREYVNETEPVIGNTTEISGTDGKTPLSADEAIKEFTIIPGVGAAKARQIYEAGYLTWDALSRANEEDLSKIEGISANLASDIIAFFQEEREAASAQTQAPSVSTVQGESEGHIAAIRGEVKEDLAVGYDEELIDIFLSATVDLFSILDVRLQDIEDKEADDDLIQELLEIVLKLRRSANYMEYFSIVDQLNQIVTLLERYLKDRHGMSPESVTTLVQELSGLKSALRRSKIFTEPSEEETAEVIELTDEDRELLQIFLSAAEQYMETIDVCLTNIRNGSDIEESVEIYKKAVESLRSSAKFMGYDSILSILEKEMKILTEAGHNPESISSLSETLGGFYTELEDEIGTLSRSAGKIPEAVEIPSVPTREPRERPKAEDIRAETPDISVMEKPGEAATPVASRRISDETPPGGSVPPGGGDEEPPGTEIPYSRKTLRVETERVDNIMNLVGELVVNRASFSQLVNLFRDMYREILELKKLDKQEMINLRQLALEFEESTTELSRVSNELQEGVMRVRMVSINQLFARFPRMVRDLANKMNKDVNLIITGKETELDKSVIEEIGDPLTHIIRNSIDHGFESPGERRKMGKPEQGTLNISAYHQGNQVIIEVSDDGRGMDFSKIKSRMESSGEVTALEAERLTERDMINYLFKPGVSLAEKVSHVSGRGVGLDIVKRNVDKLKGSIDVITELGKGASFNIKLPLTLAIIQALIVEIQQRVFSIPLSSVIETVQVHIDEIDTIEGHQVLRIRDKVLPLLHLSEIFRMNTGWESEEDAQKKVYVVILSAEGREVGLIVDRLLGEEDIVIKSLEEYLTGTRGVSGASIMGDGSISLIIDVIELVNLAIAKERELRKKQAERRYQKRSVRKRIETENDTPPVS